MMADLFPARSFACMTAIPSPARVERIRLQAIDAPEIGECRGHGGRCVSGDGYASRDTLPRLALGRTALCRPSGHSYDRIVALCSVGAVDLSCAQMRAGQAVERYGRLTCG